MTRGRRHDRPASPLRAPLSIKGFDAGDLLPEGPASCLSGSSPCVSFSHIELIILRGRTPQGAVVALYARRRVSPPGRRQWRCLQASRTHTTVGVFEADDVVLVELTEGDLEDSHRSLAFTGEPVGRLSRDEELLSDLWMEHFLPEFNLRAGIEDDPEFIAMMMELE